MAYFERKDCVQRNLYLNCVSLRKVLKACDIVWFVSSTSILRRHWPECVAIGRVNTVKPLLSGHPIKQTPSIKRTLSQVPKITSYI